MPEEKIKPKDKPHYVNNKQFSQAVHNYVLTTQVCESQNEPMPEVDKYIAECFLKICEGLSYKSNFIRYTYRDEMVMDAVENCLKAIKNYDIDKATRTQNPNAFSYFTQIAYYAFLRRIAKEKKQHDLKTKFIEKGGYEDFFILNPDEDYDSSDEYAYVEELRSRIEKVHSTDRAFKEFARIEEEKKERKLDGLEMFMGA